MSETAWKRCECVSAEVEDSTVLLNLETLVYQSLNKTASAIWSLLAEPRTTPELVDQLCQSYNVSPEQCRASVDRTLAALQDAKLVVATPGA